MWTVSKYGVISGPNTGKYGPEITQYLGTFHAVKETLLKNFFQSIGQQICRNLDTIFHVRFLNLANKNFMSVW